ncbi:acyltransferase family protein [Sphingomonas spermidinifaciens]|uniref:acyltransferase family protein n=1 Tax=Sphingomonas spermidinifaciens TaxID=1141889 RepID=UPI001FE612E8|nr:acyltransferase [Sphingomonas spermidinifaciens]
MIRTGELRALTGARGIAAWLVVFYHLRQSLPPVPAWVMAVLDKGYLAVDFFFVLSGFVIALSWGARFDRERWQAAPLFLRRRFARVWPLHAVVLTGGVGLALLLWVTGRHDPVTYPFVDLPIHYLLIQNWGFAYLAWNEPAWSISAESFAYLMFPALVFALRLERRRTATLLLLSGGLIALQAGVFAVRGVWTLGQFIPQLGLIRCVTGFTLGMLVFRLFARRGRHPALAGSATAVVAATLALGFAGLAETLVAPTGFAALVLLLALTAGRRNNPLETAVLHRLGEWSYATYLAHFLMWKAFKLAFVHAPGPVEWPLIALYAAMVLLASALLYHFVELPAQAWINRPRRTGTPKGAPALR